MSEVGRAALAAGLLAWGYAAGGYLRTLSGLVILAVLLKPGAGGSLLAQGADRIRRTLEGRA